MECTCTHCSCVSSSAPTPVNTPESEPASTPQPTVDRQLSQVLGTGVIVEESLLTVQVNESSISALVPVMLTGEAPPSTGDSVFSGLEIGGLEIVSPDGASIRRWTPMAKRTA